MARPVQLYADACGILYDTPEAADNADVAFELKQRREIVRQMLVECIRKPGGRRLLAKDASASDAADWIIANWPTIKAIGFAFRVDELSKPCAPPAPLVAAVSPDLAHAEPSEAAS